MIDKKRLTLTGKNIPDKIYQQLNTKGQDRSLTHYIVELVEKEEQMNTLISQLSSVISKLDKLDSQVTEINKKLDNVNVVESQIEHKEESKDIEATPMSPC